jgi:hypothetical protein
MHQLLRLAFTKLDQEAKRATDAERRATECLTSARSAIDARALAEAEASRTREELGMYKVQLDQAQREIHRAQELLDSLEARRREAEEDAVRARSVARHLHEARAADNAREQGRNEGYRAGVKKGWMMGWEEAVEDRRFSESRHRSRPRRSLQDVLFDEDRVPPDDPESDSLSGPSSDSIERPQSGPRPECVILMSCAGFHADLPFFTPGDQGKLVGRLTCLTWHRTRLHRPYRL